MGKSNKHSVKAIAPATSTALAPIVAPTPTTTTATQFRATTDNAPHMTDAMRQDVNSRDDVAERMKIVACYEKLSVERDTLTDNQQKALRRALRSHGFRISSYTRTATNAIVADAMTALAKKS